MTVVRVKATALLKLEHGIAVKLDPDFEKKLNFKTFEPQPSPVVESKAVVSRLLRVRFCM